MKLKQWRIMKSRTSDGCKHERLTCEDCGSFIFLAHRITKLSLKEMTKIAKSIREAENYEKTILS